MMLGALLPKAICLARNSRSPRLTACSEYRKRHPRGDETVLVAEVADTTLCADLTIKRDLYARAGVPEYWVLDVTGSRLIAHRKPAGGAYAEIVTFGKDDAIPIPARPGERIALP